MDGGKELKNDGKFTLDIEKATPVCSVDCPFFSLNEEYFYVFDSKYRMQYNCQNRKICKYVYEKTAGVKNEEN